MVIPLLMLFNMDKANKNHVTYSIILTIPFIMLPFRFNSHVSTNTVSVYVMTAVLSVFCVIDTVKDLRAFIAQKKSEGISFGEYMRSLVKTEI